MPSKPTTMIVYGQHCQHCGCCCFLPSALPHPSHLHCCFFPQSTTLASNSLAVVRELAKSAVRLSMARTVQLKAGRACVTPPTATMLVKAWDALVRHRGLTSQQADGVAHHSWHTLSPSASHVILLCFCGWLILVLVSRRTSALALS